MTSSTFQVKTLSELVRDKYGKKYMKHFEMNITNYMRYHSCGYKPNMHNYLDFDTFDIKPHEGYAHIDEYISSENVLYLILCLNSLRKHYMTKRRVHIFGRRVDAKHKLKDIIFKLIDDIQSKHYFNCVLLQYTVLIMLASLCPSEDTDKYLTKDVHIHMDAFTKCILNEFCDDVDEIIILMKVGMNNLRKRIYNYSAEYIEVHMSDIELTPTNSDDE